ncbi:uncharacterized protein N7515_003124 [Penicillium bovifimosum]|uniref:Uncharacterized protein n=1 Tax=Penicillium bovifimosum TaxID=126998 RepID=A0A9W9H5X7_9EURO|nr:uncharacterized protein N7515_003124 [Penicillium bovifimosum]KAJ5138276.1 hypothetical protein N7515_003124 [Penicillium bovifimosum]
MKTEAPDTATAPRTMIPTHRHSYTRRLDNVEHADSETKIVVLKSIARDICETFQAIAEYAEEGVLQDEHTKPIDSVIMSIRDTDVKQRRQLEKTNRRLRKERYRAHQRLRGLMSLGDALGRGANRRVKKLKNDLRKAQEEIAQLRAERDILREWAITRRKKIVTEVTDEVTDEDADGEFELVTEDNIQEKSQEAVDAGEDKGTD